MGIMACCSNSRIDHAGSEGCRVGHSGSVNHGSGLASQEVVSHWSSLI